MGKLTTPPQTLSSTLPHTSETTKSSHHSPSTGAPGPMSVRPPPPPLLTTYKGKASSPSNPTTAHSSFKKHSTPPLPSSHPSPSISPYPSKAVNSPYSKTYLLHALPQAPFKTSSTPYPKTKSYPSSLSKLENSSPPSSGPPSNKYPPPQTSKSSASTPYSWSA